jgi:radical SAM protein with 4Fe4S-binding SPASM domain
MSDTSLAILEQATLTERCIPGRLADPPYRFTEMHLELTTACNFRCGFCPLSNLQRPQAKLSFDLAKRVLTESVEFKLTRNATFHLMGEALLHPQCIEVLELCHSLGIGTRLVTNGSLYREDKYARLFGVLDRLDISCRTVDDMEVQSVQKKLTFDEYLDKVMEAVNLRASLPESQTRIRLRVFISPKTIPSLRQLCARLNVDPDRVITPRSNTPGAYETFSPLPWLSFLCEAQLDWIGGTKQYPSTFGNCDEFDTGFTVLASGDVTTCCWDAHGGNVMGNVAEQSLCDILFSEKAEAFRRSFRRHTCPTETCKKCLGRPTLIRSGAYQALSILGQRYPSN